MKEVIGSPDYLVGSSGEVRRKGSNFDLKINFSGKYPSICIPTPKGRKHWYMHRLIAVHFIDNPLNKPCVHHVNGDKSDFRVSNLRWVTYQENTREMYNTQKPIKKKYSKEFKYECIKLVREYKYSQIEVARQMQIHQQTLSRWLRQTP